MITNKISQFVFRYSTYIGLVGVILAFYYPPTIPFVTLSFAVYVLLFLGITVGLHRLFSHKSFQCNKLVKYIIGYFATMSGFTTPPLFTAIHKLHHKYSDGALDPHETGIEYFFKKTFILHDETKKEFNKEFIKSLRDPVSRFYHKYYLEVFSITILILCLLGIEFLIYGYLIPLFFVSVMASLHQVITHRGSEPRNYPLLDALTFSCGEFYHANHHEKPGSSRFGKFDIGYYVIQLIKK